ncbi:P-loop containing nucleoside triphosphate hydrolase protein [Parasitella parasitica]|nr:P-loop containing nucleoside triphosphate hydrolase protein [Parasitella parasitica]
MAKKKSKIASNRGYATTSAPSKKPEKLPSFEEKAVDNVPTKAAAEQDSPFADILTSATSKTAATPEALAEDPLLKIIKKYESLNDHKSQVALERLLKEDSQLQQIPEDRIKKFRLTAELERELLQVVKHQHGNIFGKFDQPVLKNANEYEKEKVVSRFDVLYRVLIKLGFDDEDVAASFQATFSKSLADHLDWLCINVPYERMPIGFFDKYFNEDDDNEQLILLSNQNKNSKHVFDMKPVKEDQPTAVVEKKFNKIEAIDDRAMKSRILEAAEQYMNDEEDLNVNEQYANTKLQLADLEKLLASNNHNDSTSNKQKKNKKKESDNPIVLTVAQIAKTRKDVRHIKDKLASLEVDWDFDKKIAQNIYIEKLGLVAEKKRKEQQEALEQMIKKQQKEAEERAISTELEEKAEDEEDEEDEEGGLFGGMLMDEEKEAAIMANTTACTTAITSWNIVDLSVPKSYVGRYPKDIMLEHCNKQKLGTLSYNATKEGSGIWRATLKIATEGYNLSMQYELPVGVAAESKQDAIQLIAAYALFELDSESFIYKVLPITYRDVWNGWVEEKKLREDGPRIEAEKKRLSFLMHLVEKSVITSNAKNDLTNAESSDIITNEAVTTKSKQQVLKQKKMFARVKQTFSKRLDTKDYLAMKGKRKDLPITANRQEILDLVKSNQVLIISGETGCGKSTQVPQFLAEDLLMGCLDSGSVICTQPRRISAISIANRVSIEMGDRPRSTGSREAMVGYQIRMENRMSAENVLLFCTTGILLRRLESDKLMEGVTHVVVDEVHERTIESDFLLILLRKLCRLRTDLKVVLMSATVEASRFSQYFGNCPVVSVPGRIFPVHVQYLEDIIRDTGYVLEEDSPFAMKRHRIKTEHGNINVSGQHGSSKRVHYEVFEDDSDDDPYDPTHIESKLTIESASTTDTEDENAGSRTYSRQTRKMIKRMDDKKINYDLILELLDYICIPKKSKTKEDLAAAKANELKTKGFNIPDTGAILVFLPGLNEIRKLYDLVSSHNVFGDEKKFLLIALHSTLSSEHQERAFDVPSEGIRKIVFSTNIAETGVTISDVTVVIDTGMAKVVSYDEEKRVSRLLQKYVAKANVRQRRGRAGRVQEGVCFHLFTEHKYEQLPSFETPEILRLPLEELCLRIKVCGLGGIRDVLSAALDAPTSKMIDNAILTLQEVQALSTDGQESLTPLGAHLANLPVDVHIGKMILFGAIFRCLDPILTIAAALSFKSPFVRPFGKEDEADAARAQFRVQNSDFLTIYKAYHTWREQLIDLRENKATISSLQRKMRQFCKENFLSEQNLEMIEDMKRQYMELLMSIGFVKSTDDDHFSQFDVKRGIKLCKMPETYNIYAYSLPIINAALTAGLYPKAAEYVATSKKIVNKNLELSIHPSSMLYRKEHVLTSDFLIYNTVVMNNANGQMKDKVYMWEASSIDAVAVILLATSIDIKHKQRKIILDDWIHFDCFARTAVLLKFLRQELNNWLAEKMNQPDLDLSQHNEDVMEVLVRTLESKTC